MTERLLHLRSDGGPCQHCGWTTATTRALITEECPVRLRAVVDDLAHRHAQLLFDVGTLLALAADLGDGEAHRVARVGNTRIVDLTQRAEAAEAREAGLREALAIARECWEGMRGLIAAHGYAEEDVAAMDAALSEPAPADPTAQARGNAALTDPLGQHDAALRQQERAPAETGDAQREEYNAIVLGEHHKKEEP